MAIHSEPDPPRQPIAKVNVAEIIYGGYTNNLSAEDVLKLLHDAGDCTTTLDYINTECANISAFIAKVHQGMQSGKKSP